MKPILFNTEMVRAILDGCKTMTRRVIKPQPFYGDFYGPEYYTETIIDKRGEEQPGDEVYGIWHEEGDWGIRSKYQPDDILWVRETWGIGLQMAGSIIYRADYDGKRAPLAEGQKWRPSIHMPREAARIFLRVTDVRAERVQNILCGDMIKEGCVPTAVTGGQYQQWQRDYWIPLWDAINAKRGYGWDTNPWVWAISFERCEKPVEDKA